MSEFEKETLSALLDGETDELELRRVLRQSESDGAVLETWNRYNHVQSALHGDARSVSPDFSNKIAQQLAAEPGFETAALGNSENHSFFVNWQSSVAKMAIAASVTLAFVFSFQSLSPTEQGSMPVASSSETVDAYTSPAAVIVANGDAIEVDPAAEQRLREFIGAMAFDEGEPVRIEHIQDSPLYRLVNQLEEKK